MWNTKKKTRIYTFELKKLIIGGSLIRKSKLIILYVPTAAPRARFLENKNQDDIKTSHHRIARVKEGSPISSRQVVSRLKAAENAKY